METYEIEKRDSSSRLLRKWCRRDREKRRVLGGGQTRSTTTEASQGSTAASTSLVVMRVMNQWSMGQRRRKQGLQYGCSRTIVQRGVTGAVPNGSVGPKMATAGSPTAEATCMAPESLPIKTWHCDRRAGRSAMALLPVRSMSARFISEAMANETSVSPGAPKSITSASHCAWSWLANSAKRDGGQHFAEP